MSDGKKVDETSSGEVVNGFWSCRDFTDVVPLYTPRGLYLKPIAKINVSVNLPQLKTPGKTISTWEVMEKIRALIQPDEFASLKVSKSTLEFIRLEGDLSDRCRLQRVLARLDAQRLNLAGFPNVLKVRVAEAKDDFPNRHSWDSYFRDARHMNELKPGERPDTIHVTGLPVKWFSEDGGGTPSVSVVTKVFKKWGPLRKVDVPAADVYRSRMRLGNNIQKFSFGDGIFFEAYVQYIEYMDFVKAMDALRGMKLLKKEFKNCLTAVIKVDFDKTKHMSDSSVSHREFERKRLIAQDSMAAEKLRKKEEVEAQRKEEIKKKEAADTVAKEQRRKQREEKRKRKVLRVFRKQEEDKVSMKIAREEQKLIKAQRQLESIRLLDELFDRIKIKVEKKEIVIGEKVNVTKSGDKRTENDQETMKSGDKDGDKKVDKKNKKLKKKKSKKDKKKKKKRKKDKDSRSGSSSEDSEAEMGKKKIKSVLTVNNVQPSSSAGIAPMDQNLNFPPIYPRFPQTWYYEATLPMLYPTMGRGGGGELRGGPMNRFQRGRGRGFSGRRGGNPRSMRAFNPHIYNEQYYKYFANLAGQEYPDYESDYDSRRCSESCSRSRGRSKSRSRSRGRSKSRSRSRGRSKSRSRSRGRSKSRTRSRGRSKSRSRSRGRSRSKSRSVRRSRRRRSSRSRSRSKSKSSRSRRRGGRSSSRSRNRSRTRSRSRRSRSNKRSRTRTRSKSRSRNASIVRNTRRKRSRSKVMVTRARSRSASAKRRSHSSSWSLPKSPRQRSCSWSKTVDEKKDDSSTKQVAVAVNCDAACAAKVVPLSAQTEVITPD